MLPNCGNPQKVQPYPEGWADAEISLMGRGIFSHAVRKADKAIADMDDNA